MITHEQVADLCDGDVVEIRHEDYPGVVISGPLSINAARGELMLGPITTVRLASGRSGWEGPAATLTVVSRTPRPLYVNSARTEPVPGDVVRCAEHEDCVDTWSYAPIQAAPDSPWQSTRHAGRASWDDLFDRTLLLVDGETGQVVP